MSTPYRISTEPRDPDLAGAEAAMRRSARRARERAARGAGHTASGPSREHPGSIALDPDGRIGIPGLGDTLGMLHDAGLDGSASHLRAAADRFNGNDWAGAVRESLRAVESAARQLDRRASGAPGPALKSIEEPGGTLRPTLADAFSKLYGCVSDERHVLLDRTDSHVDRDLAVFMLGACASFAGYLCRKHAAREA